MKPTNLLLFLLSFCLSNIAFSQTTLIPYGSAWSYSDNGSDPPLQGALNWYDAAYDDSGWPSGNAHLGYGDGDEATAVSSGIFACYVRHSFTVADASVYDNMDLALTYDDGAVVYLNGSEIWRVNMPGGTISYNTFASSTSSENASITTNLANALVNGTNVLTVEIHQASSSSSDISFDFKLTANPAGVVNVVRGPYLQKASAGKLFVKWRTTTSTESVISYGSSPTNLSQTVSDLSPKTEHELEISGLSANTTYYYQIENSTTVLIPAASDLYFKTSPTTGTQQLIRAWVLGDCGTANGDQRAVRDAYYNYIGSNHTDMMLFLGDNAYNDGTDAEYQTAVFENMYEDKLKNTVAWSCLGNHDGHSANSSSQTGPYYDIFSFPTAGESGGIASGTEAYYSFDYGNVHFIALDSYETDRSVGGSMYNWCQSDIQNTTAEWIVAFWHHPPYTKGSHNSDTESMLIEMRTNFLPMLESNGVDLVLSGHSHSYERSYFLNGHYGQSGTFDSAIHTVGTTGDGNGQQDGNGAYEKESTGPLAGQGAVYITTGSAGKTSSGQLNHNAMYYSVSELGSCVVEVNGNQLDVKFVRETGAVEDYFTIIKDGTPCTDSDGDGVCDAQDICPGFDDNIDSDNDGIPDGCDTDNCLTLISDDFESGFGNWNDGGSDCALTATNANSGTNSIRLRDNTGQSSSMFTNNLDLSTYDTITLAFSYYPLSMENGEDFFLEISTNGGSTYSLYQEWNAGTEFQNGTRYFENLIITSVVFTSTTRFRFRCDASGNNDRIYIDDIVITGCATNCTAGNPCDDGDACTIGDTYDINCNCIGTFQDNDGDGVCDAEDNCPGVDDNIIGTSCDDADACTTNDAYDNTCNCAGTYTDADGDGFCIGDDPDDNDACNPDPNSLACSPCTVLISDGFESGFGNWNDGGNDCARTASNSNTGSYSIRLRDNTGLASSMSTNNLDLSTYNEAQIDFSYYPVSMENGEDFFLEISTNGGSTYSLYQEWNSGTEFQNNTRYFESVTVSGIAFSTNTRFRFRCDASGNNDQIYIDDVVISGCMPALQKEVVHEEGSQAPGNHLLSNEIQVTSQVSSIKVFPNPTTGELYINFGESAPVERVAVYNLQGILLHQVLVDSRHQGLLSLDLNGLSNGIYSLYLHTAGKQVEVRKIVIMRD